MGLSSRAEAGCQRRHKIQARPSHPDLEQLEPLRFWPLGGANSNPGEYRWRVRSIADGDILGIVQFRSKVVRLRQPQDLAMRLLDLTSSAVVQKPSWWRFSRFKKQPVALLSPSSIFHPPSSPRIPLRTLRRLRGTLGFCRGHPSSRITRHHSSLAQAVKLRRNRCRNHGHVFIPLNDHLCRAICPTVRRHLGFFQYKITGSDRPGQAQTVARL